MSPVNNVVAALPDMHEDDEASLIITEFQTNGGAAAKEFIEIYNNTDSDIDFSGTANKLWKLQFFNSSAVKSGAPIWSATATASNSIILTGIISAHDYFLVSSASYNPDGVSPDQTYISTGSRIMTDTGGALQLLSQTTTDGKQNIDVHDRVMWSAQNTSTLLPAGVYMSPKIGSSLQRVLNTDSKYINADMELMPFEFKINITPLSEWSPVGLPTENSPANNPPDEDDKSVILEKAELPAFGVATNDGLMLPIITELLPNPASPMTDADNEYIEIYNPNNVPFDLMGFSLEVNTTSLRKYKFPDSSILQPKSYTSFNSGVTRLSLSNTGGQVRLKNPLGIVINETAAYGAAAPGLSWALKDGMWRWTTNATIDSENTILEPLTGAAAVAAVAKTPKATASKGTTKPKTTAKKAAANKVTIKKETKKKVKKPVPPKISTAASIKPKPPIHNGVLVAVGMLAVLYGLYEYRQDIANKYHQLRANRRSRKEDRRLPSWR